MQLKEAVEMFGVDPEQLLTQNNRTLQEEIAYRDRLGLLYARTARSMWSEKLYRSTIDLEDMWYNNPIHSSIKRLTTYKYEIQSLLGRSNGPSPMDIERARGVPLSRVLGGKGPHECPFHDERTPSLYVKDNFYKCFGCHARGDNIKFIMKTKNLDFRNAVTYLLEHE